MAAGEGTESGAAEDTLLGSGTAADAAGDCKQRGETE
jgi:hypothetical protein